MDHLAAAEADAKGFGRWQTRPRGGHWQECPAHIAKALETAFSLGLGKARFKLTQRDWGLRAADAAVDERNYEVDFSSMIQICVEAPDRKREVRRLEQDVELLPSQRQAIAYAENVARSNCGEAAKALKARMTASAWNELNQWMRFDCPVIIHTKFGQGVIDKYLADTCYRNFFEVGTGRGSTNSKSRAGWETRVFGKAFDDRPAAERPKYGVVNLTNDPKGVASATQYGTSFFVLKHALRWRCTFTSMDSCYAAAQPGTFRQFAKFFEEGSESRLTDADLLKVAQHRGEHFQVDKYKEVQIHGPVRWRGDIQILYADQDLSTEDKAKVERFAKENGFPVRFQQMHKVERFSTHKGGNV